MTTKTAIEEKEITFDYQPNKITLLAIKRGRAKAIKLSNRYEAIFNELK